MGSETEAKTYRIGELAAAFGVTCRTVRYYEELGLLEPAERGDGGHRRYSARNAIHLKRIQQLKDYGLTLADIKELFDLAREDRSGERVRRKLAEKYREKLEEAVRRKRALEDYIDDLSWHLDQLERVQDFFQCPGASCLSCPYAEKCDVRLLAAGA
ncbi:MAG TPA: MerR family transcriptional regulator [Rectinemataceae bacterium]|nr:MerR family transcriptional regulator [Rectinemataceae bacterium]